MSNCPDCGGCPNCMEPEQLITCPDCGCEGWDINWDSHCPDCELSVDDLEAASDWLDDLTDWDLRQSERKQMGLGDL